MPELDFSRSRQSVYQLVLRPRSAFASRRLPCSLDPFRPSSSFRGSFPPRSALLTPLSQVSTCGFGTSLSVRPLLPRKEVIQPHLPIRLPCYDFTPVIGLTFGSWLLAVSSLTSGAPNSHGVTGGVYKARERIHRGMLIRDY